MVPKTYTIHVKDTILATLMHKVAQPPKNTILVLTTSHAVGKISSIKHDTLYGVSYWSLWITCPTVKYDIDGTFTDDLDERL